MNFTYKQPYVTWKGHSTGSTVPTWSRPLINNNTNTNTGTSFAARPIKHWRKQLVPAVNTGITRNASMGMPMDRPGGSVYLGSAVDCSNCSVNLTELIQTTKNTIFDNTKDSSGNCLACNPETTIIKSAVTLLNKNYFSDTKAYLQSRCQTYDQKLSTTLIPGNSYINSTTHQPIPPSDSPTGSQVYYTENCSKKCATVNSVVRTIYKPNNQQYSQQGAVSSSSRLTRLKNNTITKNGNSFKTAWGQQQANAGRYQGTSDSTYFLKTKNQTCVPFHRDGNKTTSCAVPVPVPICGTIIDISTIATNTGGNNWSIVENKTIEKCQILTITNNIVLTLNAGVILTVLGIINNGGNGSGIINNGIINNQDNGIIHIIFAFLSGIDNNGIINNNDGGTIIIDGEFNNNSGGEINNNSGGEINNNSKFSNYGDFNNENGGIFNNQNGGIFYNQLNGKFYNSGQIYNKNLNSRIINSIGGVINNNTNGVIYNQNGGTIENDNGSTINNQNGGTIDNNTGGTINNNFGGIFNNIFNSIINNTGGTITNNGTLNNPSPIPPKPCGIGTINGPAIGPTLVTDACP